MEQVEENNRVESSESELSDCGLMELRYFGRTGKVGEGKYEKLGKWEIDGTEGWDCKSIDKVEM